HAKRSVGPVANPRAVFARTGDYWTLNFEGASFSLKNVRGLAYIQWLLRHPGEEFSATVLQRLNSAGTAMTLDGSPYDSMLDGLSHVTGPGDAGEMLDSQAKAEYQHRLLLLQQELNDARERDDFEHASKAEAEMDFLAKELARAVGLGGRNRKAESG